MVNVLEIAKVRANTWLTMRENVNGQTVLHRLLLLYLQHRHHGHQLKGVIHITIKIAFLMDTLHLLVTRYGCQMALNRIVALWGDCSGMQKCCGSASCFGGIGNAKCVPPATVTSNPTSAPPTCSEKGEFCTQNSDCCKSKCIKNKC